MEQYLILVDKEDRQYGKLEKLLVHQLGLLHRAFSVFIFNAKKELLIQQRSENKYHSAGLWSNTCCSHPLNGEEITQSVERRLQKEMGMKCDTYFAFSFIYKANFENGLTEHEFDHVYFGMSDLLPVPAKDEVQNWKYITIDKLEEEIKNNPDDFTEWLKLCLPEVKKRLFKK